MNYDKRELIFTGRCLCCSDPEIKSVDLILDGVELQSPDGNWAIDVKELIKQLKLGGRL